MPAGDDGRIREVVVAGEGPERGSGRGVDGAQVPRSERVHDAVGHRGEERVIAVDRPRLLHRRRIDGVEAGRRDYVRVSVAEDRRSVHAPAAPGPADVEGRLHFAVGDRVLAQLAGYEGKEVGAECSRAPLVVLLQLVVEEDL